MWPVARTAPAEGAVCVGSEHRLQKGGVRNVRDATERTMHAFRRAFQAEGEPLERLSLRVHRARIDGVRFVARP